MKPGNYEKLGDLMCVVRAYECWKQILPLLADEKERGRSDLRKRNRYILCGDFEFLRDGENWKLTNLTVEVDGELWRLLGCFGIMMS